MRSVVVVLPASMWAMIPMLRVRSRGWLRLGIVPLSLRRRATTEHVARSSGGSTPGVALPPGGSGGLPAVVSEGLVRLGHLVHIFLALDRAADAVVGIEQLGGQALGHRAFPAVAREPDDPPDGERGGT